jgi:nucleotide-binding universal stress UspA family protein
MDTILVGYDGSGGAERALARAADLAEALSARLVVASITPLPAMAPVLEPQGPMFVPGAGAGPPATAGTVPLAELERERVADSKKIAQHVLEQARTALAQRRVEAEYVADVGTPPERLLELAEQRHADPIVVGSREHGFIERLLARPVDEAVARRSARDVLLVH